MHSWRVLILPYFDEPELSEIFRQYRLDESWNSPNNAAVTRKVPPYYRCPKSENDGGTDTSFVMLIRDKDSKVEDSVRVPGRTDGIYIAEVEGSGVHWAEPRDIEVDRLSDRVNDPNQVSISSKHRDGAHVLLHNWDIEILATGTYLSDWSPRRRTEPQSPED
jgi:hypothetical protein